MSLKKLTKLKRWDSYYQNRKLPKKLNVKVYKYYLFDKFFKSHLDKGKKKILEVGCGCSPYLPYFYKEFGYEVYGLDYSKVGCQLAQENLRLLNAIGEIYCEDIMNTTLPNEFFDIVFSSGLIEHFEDPLIILKKMDGLLRPNGILITFIPNTTGFIWQRLYNKVDKNGFKGHKILAPLDLKKYYSTLGLRNIEVNYLGTFKIPTFEGIWPDASLLLRCLKPSIIKIGGLLNDIMSYLCRNLNYEFPNRFFSPYIFAIGEKGKK